MEFKMNCPVCGSNNTRNDYDFPSSMKNCDNCGSEWVYNTDGCVEITFNSRRFKEEDE